MADVKPSPTKGKEEAKVSTKDINLPLSRIRTIMKSSPESEAIGNTALVVVTKAAEMFIQHMTREALKKSKKPTVLEYRDLAGVVNGNEKLEFLAAIIPRKITVREYKEILDNDSDSEFDSMASSSEEESSSGDESGSSEDVVEVSSDENEKKKK